MNLPSSLGTSGRFWLPSAGLAVTAEGGETSLAVRPPGRGVRRAAAFGAVLLPAIGLLVGGLLWRGGQGWPAALAVPAAFALAGAGPAVMVRSMRRRAGPVVRWRGPGRPVWVRAAGGEKELPADAVTDWAVVAESVGGGDDKTLRIEMQVWVRADATDEVQVEAVTSLPGSSAREAAGTLRAWREATGTRVLYAEREGLLRGGDWVVRELPDAAGGSGVEVGRRAAS